MRSQNIVILNSELHLCLTVSRLTGAWLLPATEHNKYQYRLDWDLLS